MLDSGPDPTSRTGRDCPLPDLSVPNHRAYSDAWQSRWMNIAWLILLGQWGSPPKSHAMWGTESGTPRLQIRASHRAATSRQRGSLQQDAGDPPGQHDQRGCNHWCWLLFLVWSVSSCFLLIFCGCKLASEAFLSADSPDWVFFIDCDAFFTDLKTSLTDILATYGVSESDGPHFLVAEDPGGINTGTAWWGSRAKRLRVSNGLVYPDITWYHQISMYITRYISNQYLGSVQIFHDITTSFTSVTGVNWGVSWVYPNVAWHYHIFRISKWGVCLTLLQYVCIYIYI